MKIIAHLINMFCVYVFCVSVLAMIIATTTRPAAMTMKCSKQITNFDLVFPVKPVACWLTQPIYNPFD